MRIWSIHPKYLDNKGLVALWRETLLAKKVLEGKTKGYKKHPQLKRFKESKKPLQAINYYLNEVLKESKKRNFNFDEKKIGSFNQIAKIPVNSEQINFEFKHLLNKLKERCPEMHCSLKENNKIVCHPLFKKRKGCIESWERVNK